MILIFYNSQSRKAMRVLEQTRDFLRKKAVPFSETGDIKVVATIPSDEAWIIGGDGTLHYFIQHFPDWSKPIHLLPAGTGNDLVRHIYNGLPELSLVWQVGLRNHVVKTDAGICNGELFLNGIGIGFDGAVGHSLAENPWLRGFLGYYFHVIRLLFFYREKKEILQQQDVFMITIGNGSSFGGGFRITPLADMQDGLFEICEVKKVTRLQRILNLLQLRKGKHLGLPFVHYRRAESLSLEFEKEVPAHIDGEVFSARKFDIRILPGRFLLKLP